ncbi:uncharacterized protein [Rutidosis leptorrhynchoides]|uniref:uncharacterized protein n=1 Tax=Rutidosis leptorrhynchoides TaxID=125765 RepID=UPI003A99E28F
MWDWTAVPRWRVAAELQQLESLVAAYNHSNSNDDKWKWVPNSNGFFSTRLMLLHLENHLNSPSGFDPTIRNKLIPQKIEILIWRAIQNKLPVRTELDRRGIDLHSTRCPVCDDAIESLNHTLILCKSSFSIWERIFKWWNLDMVIFSDTRELASGSNAKIKTSTGYQIWQAVVWTTTYFIWKNRNDHVFNKSRSCIAKIVSEIQSKSFEWISSRLSNGNLDWLNWLTIPWIYDVNLPRKEGIG